MLRKKAFSIWLVVLASLLVVLAGCSGGEGSENSSGGSGEGETAQKTIKFMHLWPEGSSNAQYTIVENIIDQFENENPNVKVEVEPLGNEQYKQKMKVLSSSGELPDVGMTWAAGFLTPYVEGNLFAPLNDVLEGGLQEKFVSGTTEAYAIDGKTYGLPLELNIAPIFYNKAIFEENGLEVPKTYEEFKNVVKTLKGNGVTPIALGNKDRWTGSLWYMYLADRIGGAETLTNAINRSGSFEDPALVKAATEIQNLVDLGAFSEGYNALSDQEAKGLFMNGQAAMYLIGSWDLPNYTTSKDVPQEFKDSIGFFNFPTVNGKGDLNSWVGGPGVGLFVAENSDVKKEAKDFVTFFAEQWGEQAVTDAGVIPATKVDTGAVELPDMYIDVLDELNQASNITLFADVQMNPDVAQVHLDAIQSLFGDEITPEEFTKMQEDALAETE
ncbi:extracellular solute-binding protein [Aquibacillus sp. 3ASR75-11]|uniref:Extracellular solute-binding protein n=1 Tax=Terrihalobacillus insolitus TaxID=2950438 RepID=A0A9X3WQW1_9BACI|nr:extracellular solute-binding protein [Terrihalobacillus insolitus]MDC3412099.1 extracellular solute-binding protein [Terrihalobacillus insolitus]MDC3423208.1 extracellular solute-binding protein [Terrihalobacillus insolitus]